MPDILDAIVSRKFADYARFGPTFGADIPATRLRAVVPFLAAQGTILEIKRASPSKGDIAPYLDPVRLAKQYAAAGTKNISVLTEQHFFKGGLSDLVAASQACPDIAFLRKDFLLHEDEIEVAYRAGADAVLLIARILELPLLLRMAAAARKLGMTAFIEVRENSDIPKLKACAKAGPVLAGVNARDLATFRLDPLVPATLRGSLPCRTVFESGASSPGACRFARRLGFDGILIGEAAARNPEKAGELVSAFGSARPDWVGHFWREIAKRAAERIPLAERTPLPELISFAEPTPPGEQPPPAAGSASGSAPRRRPLVKICGLTNAADALCASDLGADLLGFVFAQSPRACDEKTVREIASILTVRSRPNARESVGAPSVRGALTVRGALALNGALSARDALSTGGRGLRQRPLLVGVITDPGSAEAGIAIRLALEGILDAIQYHGVGDALSLGNLDSFGGMYGIGRFAAVRLGSEEDLSLVESLVKAGEPRVLVDAKAEGTAGGTGTAIPESLAARVRETCALWLAGGLDPSNVRKCVDEYSPELIDASSGLESAPGKKDHALLESFFREIA